MTDIEAAVQRWRDAGPLSAESTKLLLDWREANITEQSTDLIFAALVRSLTEGRSGRWRSCWRLWTRMRRSGCSETGHFCAAQ
jgi:hypothetical protein